MKINYLIQCRVCGDMDNPLLFDTEAERLEWGKEHNIRTSHDNWAIGKQAEVELEAEPIEAELLCFKSPDCILEYEHEGVCRFKGGIPNRFAAPRQTNNEEPQRFSDDPSFLNGAFIRYSRMPSLAQRLMGNIFAQAMNAGVADATITITPDTTRFQGHMGGHITHEEIDGHQKEIGNE